MAKLSSIKHEGLRTNRLQREPLEKAFAKAWKDKNEKSAGVDLLDYLLAEDPNHPKGEVSQRDATVAATVIQWLGSHVGQCFLRDVRGNGDEKA
jgi:hypothetical protein